MLFPIVILEGHGSAPQHIAPVRRRQASQSRQAYGTSPRRNTCTLRHVYWGLLSLLLTFF